MGNEQPALALADFVERADMRMIEGRRRAGFAVEPLNRRTVLREAFGKELERHSAPETQVLGLVDDAHAPTAQQAEHAVMGHGLVNHDWRSGF